MARPRDQAKVGLPKIEIDEPKTVRLNLRGRLHQELEVYRAASKEAYGMEVELEALIPHMLETYIQSDRAFRTWRNGRSPPPSD